MAKAPNVTLRQETFDFLLELQEDLLTLRPGHALSRSDVIGEALSLVEEKLILEKAVHDFHVAQRRQKIVKVAHAKEAASI